MSDAQRWIAVCDGGSGLEGLDLAAHPRARPAREVAVTDSRNPCHRLDDPSDRAKGWQIGSIPVEAA